MLKPAPQTPLTTLRIGELLRSLLPRGARSSTEALSFITAYLRQWATCSIGPGVLNVVVGSDLNTPRPVLAYSSMNLHYVYTLMIMLIADTAAICSYWAMVFIIVVFDCFGRPGEILTSHDLAPCLQ